MEYVHIHRSRIIEFAGEGIEFELTTCNTNATSSLTEQLGKTITGIGDIRNINMGAEILWVIITKIQE